MFVPARILKQALPLAALLSAGAALAAPHFQVTYEAAGVQSANQAALCSSLGGTPDGSCVIGVETFDGRGTSASATFDTDFGIASPPATYPITGTYTGVQINSYDQYGGAGGAGNYAVTFATGGYTLDLGTDNPNGINYFGFWLSALDRGNQLEFYSSGTLVYTFVPDDVIALVGDCPNAANPYCSNPNSGQNGDEPYVFLNFFYRDGGTFDRIVFSENPEVGGYESDNHTVGYVTGSSGTPVEVPLPGTLLLGGIGMLGLGAVSRRRKARA